MARWCAVALGCLLMVVGCDHPAPGPTQPSGAPGPGLSTPQLTVRIDGPGSSVAIAGVSEVSFDARGTPGDKLRYDIQFGDGESASTPLTTHVYATPGTFSATLTVTDAAERRSSTSATVVVKAVTGTWFYSDYNDGSRRAEAHRISITSQDGATLRGVYSTLDEADRAIAGTMTADRSVHLQVADQSVRFDGYVPGEVASDFSLTAGGSRISGQALIFKRAAEDSSGPAPTARLAVRFDEKQSFGMGTWPVMGITQITFDASSSTGDHLSYIIEYGDGEFAREPSVIHPAMRSGSLIARVTVTDPFGRFAVASQRFGPVVGLDDMSDFPGCTYTCQNWRNDGTNANTNRWERRALVVAAHDGLTFTGNYYHPEGGSSPFTGTLDGHGGLTITLVGGGITFSGAFHFTQKNSWGNRFFAPDLQLTARGGGADGRTLYFVWYDVYA